MSERDSAAYKVFHQYFSVKVPNLYLYTEEELRMLPIHNGFGSISDEEIMQSERKILLSLDKIAGLRNEGAPVTFMKPNDCLRAYQILVQHLNDWKYVLQNHFSHPQPPLDDLTVLEALAMELHPFVGNRAALAANKSDQTPTKGRPFMARATAPGQKIFDERDVKDYRPIMPMITQIAWRKYGHSSDTPSSRN